MFVGPCCSEHFVKSTGGTHMTFKPWVAAAALTVCGVAAQAANNLGAIGPGEHVFDISLSTPGTAVFAETLSFSLASSSHVTGALSGGSVLGVSYQRFSEMGNIPVVKVTPVGSAFDLGLLVAPIGVGFESGLYTLNLSGLLDNPAATSMRLTLNVTAVPEVSTWSMLALGLGGMAAVRRRAAASQA
jgi:hypothetical protein